MLDGGRPAGGGTTGAGTTGISGDDGGGGSGIVVEPPRRRRRRHRTGSGVGPHGDPDPPEPGREGDRVGGGRGRGRGHHVSLPPPRPTTSSTGDDPRRYPMERTGDDPRRYPMQRQRRREGEGAPLIIVGRSSTSSPLCGNGNGIGMGDGGGRGDGDGDGDDGSSSSSSSEGDDDCGTNVICPPLHLDHTRNGAGGPSRRRRRDGYRPIGDYRDTDNLDHPVPRDRDYGRGGGNNVDAAGSSSSSKSSTSSWLYGACVCVAWFSLGGVAFLVFVLVLIERQPFFMRGLSSRDDDALRRAATNTSLGALAYGASLVISLCGLRHHDRIERWRRGFALRVRALWQRRRSIRRRGWSRRWSTTTTAAAAAAGEGGAAWMYSYHAADPHVGGDGVGSDTGASVGTSHAPGGDEEVVPLRRRAYRNRRATAGGGGGDAQYGTFELWKLRWNGVVGGNRSGADGPSECHNKTKRR